MKKLLHVELCPSAVAGVAKIIFTPSTNYEDVLVQLTNESNAAVTAVLKLVRGGGNLSYRISPAALALAPGGALTEVSVPGVTPGDELELTVTGADGNDAVQALVWGKVANAVRS